MSPSKKKHRTNVVAERNSLAFDPKRLAFGLLEAALVRIALDSGEPKIVRIARGALRDARGIA